MLLLLLLLLSLLLCCCCCWWCCCWCWCCCWMLSHLNKYHCCSDSEAGLFVRHRRFASIIFCKTQVYSDVSNKNKKSLNTAILLGSWNSLLTKMDLWNTKCLQQWSLKLAFYLCFRRGTRCRPTKITKDEGLPNVDFGLYSTCSTYFFALWFLVRLTFPNPRTYEGTYEGSGDSVALPNIRVTYAGTY